VAQCANRMRMAGHPDPTVGLDSLDDTVFDLFPAKVTADLGDRLFSLHVGSISFEAEPRLIQSLAAFWQLPPNLQRTRFAADFLIQAGRGALKLGRPSLAFPALAKALTVAPVQVCAVAGGKALRLLRASFSDRGGDNSASPKISIE
jgi:hypothetical protein